MEPWIEAKDSMPDENQDVEVLGSDGKIRQAYGCSMGRLNGFMVNATEDFISGAMHYDITHWRAT